MLQQLRGTAQAAPNRTRRSSSRGSSRTARTPRPSGVSIVQWITPSLTVSGIVAALISFATGRLNLPSLDSLRGKEPPVVEDPIATTFVPTDQAFPRGGYSDIAPVGLVVPTSTNKSDRSIRVATYNIQVFGKSKSEKPDVVRQLAQICLLFDVIAIQEIKGDPAIPVNALLSAIATQGGRYQAIVGPPLGRTTQTECYGFVWDQTRVDLVPDSQYTIEDRADRMHREPLVASFQTRVAPTDSHRPFRFTMINTHTDPDEVFGSTGENELNVLDDVFRSVRDWDYQTTGEDDFLLVGDLNVDVAGLKELGQIPNVVSMVGDVPTNTAGTKTYDHLLLDRAVTREPTGRMGVLDVRSMLKLDDKAVAAISDHLPVWAEFSVYEIPPGGFSSATVSTAAAPSGVLRR